MRKTQKSGKTNTKTTLKTSHNPSQYLTTTDSQWGLRVCSGGGGVLTGRCPSLAGGSSPVEEDSAYCAQGPVPRVGASPGAGAVTSLRWARNMVWDSQRR